MYLNLSLPNYFTQPLTTPQKPLFLANRDLIVPKSKKAALFGQADPKTVDNYDRQASEIAERFEKTDRGFLGTVLDTVFLPGSRVLDVGPGSGKDMVTLYKKGCIVDGIDPSAGMRAQTLLYHPELEGHLYEGSLPNLDSAFDGKYDGILCAAVLIHLPKSQLDDAIKSFKKALKGPGGKVMLSFPSKWIKLENERDGQQRLVVIHSAQEVENAFLRNDFKKIWGVEKADDRPGQREKAWQYFLFELSEPLNGTSSVLPSGKPLTERDTAEKLRSPNEKVLNFSV